MPYVLSVDHAKVLDGRSFAAPSTSRTVELADGDAIEFALTTGSTALLLPVVSAALVVGNNHDGLCNSVYSRAVPDFVYGSGRNPAFCPNPAEIRLRQISHRSRIVLPDLKSQFLTEIR